MKSYLTSFKLFIQHPVLLLGSSQLISWSGVFTVFNFYQVDVSPMWGQVLRVFDWCQFTSALIWIICGAAQHSAVIRRGRGDGSDKDGIRAPS